MNEFYKMFFHCFRIDYNKKTFSIKKINRLFRKEKIIDGRGGGLFLGPSHSMQGIKFIVYSNGKFMLVGELEGYEYVVNKKSALRNWERLSVLNNISRDDYGVFNEYKVPINIKTVDTWTYECPLIHSKYVLFDDSMFIVNIYSTEKHLAELDKINSEH